MIRKWIKRLIALPIVLLGATSIMLLIIVAIIPTILFEWAANVMDDWLAAPSV